MSSAADSSKKAGDDIITTSKPNPDFDEKIALLDTDNIFELGFVNSMFAMKLLNFVEKF